MTVIDQTVRVRPSWLRMWPTRCAIDHTNRTDRVLLRRFLVRSEYILRLNLETAESWVLQELSLSEFLDDLVEMFDFDSEVELTFDCRLPTGHFERDWGEFQ
jgi:hypothetical protein